MGRMESEERVRLRVFKIMLGEFEYIAVSRWKLTLEQTIKLLNLGSVGELLELRAVEKVPDEEVFLRIGYVEVIFLTLHVLLPDRAAADAWIRKPNNASLFGGRPAIEKMTSGKLEDLKAVWNYLESQTV